MGGKGGVGKTNFMTGLAEWYQDHQIPRHVDSILKHGLDRLPLDTDDAPPRPRLVHANVRGPAYYQEGDTEC